MIQEVILAKRVVLQVNGDTVCMTQALYQKLNRLELQYKIATPTLLKFPNTQGLGIVQALQLSLSANASDKRDVVYGVASLLQDEIRRLVPIDYRLSHDEVLCRALQGCLVEQQSLNIITTAALRQGADMHDSCSFNFEDLHEFLRLEPGLQGGLDDFSKSKMQIHRGWKGNVQVMIDSTTSESMEKIDQVYGPYSVSSVRVVDSQLPKHQILPRLTVHSQLFERAYK